MRRIQLLDCTLRDGAYIVDGKFGTKTIKGLVGRLQEAKIDIIECGWLKDFPHESGTSYYNVPEDVKQYLNAPKAKDAMYVAMIDYNRYNVEQLSDCDGESIDAIRIVFPKNKVQEGISLVNPIRKKGYKVYLQAANTLDYTDEELVELVHAVNEVDVEALSIVDTFGTMYEEDLQRILSLVNSHLRKDVAIGFHSHNNQQLSFSLSMKFVEKILEMETRRGIVDSSLCGMGRGAGNTPTELIIRFLNERYHAGYGMNSIMDAIDLYMNQFISRYKWGYSIPYMLAGMYGCHVNNVTYLTKVHRTKSKDMKIIFELMEREKRFLYDYDEVEKVYIEYQNRKVNDIESKKQIKDALEGRNVVIVLPGMLAEKYRKKAEQCIIDTNAIVVGVNAIVEGYSYDYLFFNNMMKLELAREGNFKEFDKASKIITSNIKEVSDKKTYVVNYNELLKKRWKYHENSLIMFLRLLNDVMPKNIYFVGFDGWDSEGDECRYADVLLESERTNEEMFLLKKEVEEMFEDYVKENAGEIKLHFVTPSRMEEIVEKAEV